MSGPLKQPIGAHERQQAGAARAPAAVLKWTEERAARAASELERNIPPGQPRRGAEGPRQTAKIEQGAVGQGAHTKITRGDRAGDGYNHKKRKIKHRKTESCQEIRFKPPHADQGSNCRSMPGLEPMKSRQLVRLKVRSGSHYRRNARQLHDRLLPRPCARALICHGVPTANSAIQPATSEPTRTGPHCK
jgi:hypothetical protein